MKSYALKTPLSTLDELFSQLALPQLNTRSLLARVREWQQRAVQRQALASLDQRMLDDIGVDSVDAAIEARKPFWQD